MDEAYIRFRETNNWESECWCFYIPLRGNEKAIRELSDAVQRLNPVRGCFVGMHIQYNIRLMPVPGDKVDRACASGKGGYMAYHNRLEGRLDIRAVRRAARLLAKEARLASEKPDATRTVEDDLYKGGIADMMRPWKMRPATTDWPTAHIRAALRRTPISKWGDRFLPQDMHIRSFQRKSWGSMCWDARARLQEAGLRTVGDVADLTEKKLLATSGIGRKTVNMTRWMLGEVGLDFTAKESKTPELACVRG